MPRVHKTHDYEAVRLEHDLKLVNERTGERGKPMARGMILLTDLTTGDQWFLTPEEFHASGWAAVDESDAEYFS